MSMQIHIIIGIGFKIKFKLSSFAIMAEKIQFQFCFENYNNFQYEGLIG